METLIGLLVSIAAGVIANYISKRLDRHGEDHKGQ